MIKSDLMNRKLIFILALLLLLTGCGSRRQPDVEHFQGDVVATLQRPISQEVTEIAAETPPPSSELTITPETSQSFPTDSPGGTLTATVANPQPSAYPGNAGTTPAAPEPTTTTNLTQTPTAMLGIPSWVGAWNIWYQSANGGYTPAELTVQVDDVKLTASAKIEGIDFTFEGEIFAEGSQVEGKWQTATNKGSFWWRMNSADTFVGSREKRFGFCGNRATAIQPNPCREVPQN